MRKIKPILTEKSLAAAKEGKYTFWVEKGMNKYQIRQEVSRIFGVEVKKVWTINVAGEIVKNIKGKKVRIASSKKAIVTTEGDKKIGVFEAEKSGKAGSRPVRKK